MEIRFCLEWLESRRTLNSKTFKSEAARTLFLEYIDRISRFVSCRAVGSISGLEVKKSGSKTWVCDRSPGARELSSEELALRLEKLQDSGVRELNIVIGGPDGLSKKEIEELSPDLRWNFGPMTLPHELAAVVASEQIYRAWTIIKHMPYHSGH